MSSGLDPAQEAGLAASEAALAEAPGPGPTISPRPTPTPTALPLAVFRDLCLDAVDPQRVGTFWAAVLGREVEDAGQADGISRDVLLRTAADGGLNLYVNGVAEPKAGKNRMHLDVTMRDGRQVDELLSLGATIVTEPDAEPWWVLADPEGNEFCAFLPSGASPDGADQAQADPVADGAATNDADAETAAP